MQKNARDCQKILDTDKIVCYTQLASAVETFFVYGESEKNNPGGCWK